MIAVTGASGYIGRATLVRLARAGTVVAVSRRAPSFALPDNVIWSATGDETPQPEVFAGCESVIHLAGRAHTTVAQADGQNLFDLANRRLAVDTAIAARAVGVRRFVFVSTIGVHGNWSEESVHADSPLRLDTPYALSKNAAEQELMRVSADTGIGLCIVRPTMVYGPRCPGNFTRLLNLVATGLPLPFGSMRATRSFIEVDNLASFLDACATRPLPALTKFVVGDGSDWSTAELVASMAEALRMPSRVFPFPLSILRFAAAAVGRSREVDSLTRPMQVDSTEAWKMLAWRPHVDKVRGLLNAVGAHAT